MGRNEGKAAPVSRLGVRKKMSGVTAGIADQNWPKGYFIARPI